MDTSKIPAFISHVTKKLQEAGFEAYLVGGCVRDMIMERTPKDWDLATNAHPEQVQEIFKENRTIYENDFGTVTVLDRAVSQETGDTGVSHETIRTAEVQITTYRSEGDYGDSRHPNNVSYETSIEKDLERRDFTINAIAYDPIKDTIKDIFDGIKDIKDKRIQCVLNPDTRLKEDALRMLRAVRFSTVLGFAISHETTKAVVENAGLIQHISGERIRDEFIKIVESAQPAAGVDLMQRLGLLQYIIPELEEGIGCEQKGAHIYDVYRHIFHAFQHAADKGFSLEIRLAALFHDIGKPRTRRYDKTKDKYTFFGHEVVGARMTKVIMERLRFSRETIDLVVSLVRNHMFFSDTEKITLSAVRRIITKVGPAHIWQLMEVRESDRVGMKKAEAPYRLRKYHAMIEEALRDPISVGQLAIDGNYLQDVLHMKPSRRMGWMLHALLEEVLEDPTLNTIERLTERVKNLEELADADLQKLGEQAKQQKDILEHQEVEKLHKKHNVKNTKRTG